MSRAADESKLKKSSGKPDQVATSHEATFRGFVNVDLSESDKRDFVIWSETAGWWDVFQSQSRDGVAISTKYSDKEKCFLSSGTQRRTSSPNAGLVVTARSAEPGKAFMRLLYILMMLGKKERWEFTQPIADPDRW